MSVIVKGGGGSTAKELVNSTGAKLADLEKKGSGKVSVVGGLGNTPPEKVLQGSIYSDESGVRRTGTMEDITPELNTQSDLIKEIRAMLVGRVTEANATPEDILKGKKAYVGEKLVTGVLEPVYLKEMFGYSKISIKTLTFSSDESARNKILEHGLGAKPSAVLLFSAFNPMTSKTNSLIYTGGWVAEGDFLYPRAWMYKSSSGVDDKYGSPAVRSVTETTLTVNVDGCIFAAGVPYTLITMA